LLSADPQKTSLGPKENSQAPCAPMHDSSGWVARKRNHASHNLEISCFPRWLQVKKREKNSRIFDMAEKIRDASSRCRFLSLGERGGGSPAVGPLLSTVAKRMLGMLVRLVVTGRKNAFKRKGEERNPPDAGGVPSSEIVEMEECDGKAIAQVSLLWRETSRLGWRTNHVVRP
jgi:hypothetical protein